MTVAQRREIAKWVLGLLFLGLMIAVVVFSAGCGSTTVVPARVEAKEIAFEGNEQNAGLLGPTAHGWFLTEHKKAEYDALVALYGQGTETYPIMPAVRKNVGLMRVAGAGEGFPEYGWVWKIDSEHLSWFITFREWQRTGRKPR